MVILYAILVAPEFMELIERSVSAVKVFGCSVTHWSYYPSLKEFKHILGVSRIYFCACYMFESVSQCVNIDLLHLRVCSI